MEMRKQQVSIASAHDMNKVSLFSSSPETLMKKKLSPLKSTYEVEPSEYTCNSLKHFVKNTCTFQKA